MAYVSISQPMLKECRCAVANFKGRMTIPKGHFGKTRTLFVCILDAEHMHVNVLASVGSFLGGSLEAMGGYWGLQNRSLEPSGTFSGPFLKPNGQDLDLRSLPKVTFERCIERNHCSEMHTKAGLWVV